MDPVRKDKRFQHVISDPRFRKVPRSERKVKIDSRFKAMFTDDRFKLEYAVDKRGRRVNQTHMDDLKKYYDLSDSEGEQDKEAQKKGTIVPKKKIDAGAEDSVEDEEESTGDEGSADEDESGAEEGSIDDEESADDEELADDDESTVDGGKSFDEGEPALKKSREKSKNLQTDTNYVESVASDSESVSSSAAHAKSLLQKEELKRRSKLVDSYHKEMMKEDVVEKLKDMTVDYARGIGTLGNDDSSSDESPSDDSSDELVHPWGELDRDAERTDDVTSRLAACNLDWDRITAKDLFVLMSSFLPAEGFVKSVTIYPSEFGLERMKEEETNGPKELFEEKVTAFDEEDFTDSHAEGSQYCMEKLREYQLNRLKYYYAVLVFDSAETANKIYMECDGIEYESSATRLDLRFIPDDMEFEHEPKDTCTSMPDVTKYKPRLFVNSALMQGTVSLTWDETDPNRVEFTKKLTGGGNLTEDDLRAYVAAPSDNSDEDDREKDDDRSVDEEKQHVETSDDPISKYKALLSTVVADKKKPKSDVDMEVSWGVGLDREDSGSEIGDVQDSEDAQPKKEKKRGKTKKGAKKAEEAEEDDGKSAELELLLADDVSEENKKAHFNFKEIQKEEQRKGKKRKFQKNKKEVAEDDFEIDVNDSRFSALYTSHHFNIDPADPHFVRTEAAERIIKEKQKRRKLHKGELPEVVAEKPKINAELASLVKSIKGKQAKN